VAMMPFAHFCSRVARSSRLATTLEVCVCHR
jgi:hypothetical protein